MIYELISKDLTYMSGLSISPLTNWRKFFQSVEAARRYAIGDYRKHRPGNREEIKWSKEGKGWSSQDLGFVQYSIEPVAVESRK